MKGVSKFISYALTVLFGFIILIFLSTLVYHYYDEILQNTIKGELKQICVQTENSIIQLHNLAKEFKAFPEESSSIIIQTIDLGYPTDVEGRNYEVELISSPGIWNIVTNLTIEGRNVTIVKETSSSSKIIARTTQKPIVVYEHDIPNIPIVLQGKFKPGESDTLKLLRYNYNGTIEDRIILGDSEIIVGITNIK
jgi:hypothetical protein